MQTDSHMIPTGTEENSRRNVPLPEQTEDAIINAAAARILEQYLPAFQELAK